MWDPKLIGNSLEASWIAIGQRHDLCAAEPAQCREVAIRCHSSAADDTNSKRLSHIWRYGTILTAAAGCLSGPILKPTNEAILPTRY